MADSLWQPHGSGPDHVPTDYDGPIVMCQVCGNDAPDVKRGVTDDGVRECTSCFTGRLANGVATPGEARFIRSELFRNIRDGEFT